MREKIIQRLKKLKAHAESARALGSLEEAESFTLKMQELMLEYNIAMMEVDAAEEMTRDEFHNWGYTESISYHEGATDYRWRRELVRVLCHYNFCGWYINSKKWRMFQVYGQADNVDVVVFLYNYLSIGFFRLAADAFKANPHGLKRYEFLKTFLYGAVHGLRDKLEAQRKQQQQSTVVLGLVKVNAAALDRYSTQVLKLNKVKNRPVNINYTNVAYLQGYVAGQTHTVGAKLNSENNSKNIL